MYRISQAVALGLLVLGGAPELAGQSRRPAAAAPTEAATALVCTSSAEGAPGGIMARVAHAIGMSSTESRALRVRAWNYNINDFQSDRTYPPFFAAYQSTESWFDARAGALATRLRAGVFPRTEAAASPFSQVSGAWASWFVRDTLVRAGGTGAESRALNPWAVVHDFLRPGEVTIDGRCTYRDYPRIALRRTGVFGPERLLIDPKTMVPVALVRDEPHYLWGQVRAEYVWSNWDDVSGGGIYPLSAFRQIDGETNVSVTAGNIALMAPDSAPRLTIPDTALRAPSALASALNGPQPDTVRVDANTWLLVAPAYTITVTLQRDTVFVLDATTSETRARQDAAWIARLFPGRHPVVVVVTDLAWPHIAGVRYWVARGATIVSHRASRAFLQRVVDRRWTLRPDSLEQIRTRAHLVFRAVDDSLVLAGGDLVLHPIDGIASEASLMAWLPGGSFLWASDYIQDTRAPTSYAREVLRATRRVGIAPTRFAAEHVRLTPWRTIDSLLAAEAPAATRDLPDATTLHIGRIAKRATTTRNGESTDRGERVQQLSRGTYRGRPALISVQVFDTPQGPATDSSMADPVTLAPIRHVGAHTSRTMILDFDGPRVTGSYRDSTGLRAINQPMDGRPYDSSLFDLVFAALPLAEGYSARLPFYVYERGGAPVWYDGRVTGTEAVTLRDGTTAETWVLDVSEDGRLRSRLWITRTGEREVVRSTYYISPGMEFTNSR